VPGPPGWPPGKAWPAGAAIIDLVIKALGHRHPGRPTDQRRRFVVDADSATVRDTATTTTFCLRPLVADLAHRSHQEWDQLIEDAVGRWIEAADVVANGLTTIEPDRLRLRLSSTVRAGRQWVIPGPRGLSWEIIYQLRTGDYAYLTGWAARHAPNEPDRWWAAAERASVAVAQAGLATLAVGGSHPLPGRCAVLSGPFVATLALRRPYLVASAIVAGRSMAKTRAAVAVYGNSLCLFSIAQADDTQEPTDALDQSLRRFVRTIDYPLGPVTVPVDPRWPPSRDKRCQTNE
jgi:hypothetical protein